MALFATVAFTLHAQRGKPSAPVSVLARLDSFVAPPFPASQLMSGDAYDARIKQGLSVPSKRMALVADVCALLQKADNTFKSRLADAPDVSSGIAVYETKDWMNIIGYRPWTNWHFVRGLTAPERAVLVSEIVTVMKSGRLNDSCE